MLGAVTRVNHPLAAISVGEHSTVTALGGVAVAAATTVPATAAVSRL